MIKNFKVGFPHPIGCICLSTVSTSVIVLSLSLSLSLHLCNFKAGFPLPWLQLPSAKQDTLWMPVTLSAMEVY